MEAEGAQDQRPTRVGISVVTYRCDVLYLKVTLLTLSRAVTCARRHHPRPLHFTLFIVDNSPNRDPCPDLVRLLRAPIIEAFDAVEVIRSERNVGFGGGHNLAILSPNAADTDFHLVLNPDVELDDAALYRAVDYLEAHPKVVAIVPWAMNSDGAPSYLAKAEPSVIVLFLRAYLPWVRLPALRRRLDRYELRPESEQQRTLENVPMASGCFLVARSAVLRELGGFSPDYFLYFEDFDLSIRMRRHGRVDFVPDVRLIHHGGNVARKGLRHLLMFARSAIQYFRDWGWQFW